MSGGRVGVGVGPVYDALMPASVNRVMAALEKHKSLGPQLSSTLTLPPHEESLELLEPPLPEALSGALEQLGIGGLWSHQVAGLRAARQGRNTLVTTPTASGKSLVFHLPVLEEEIVGGPGRALFLYPLKALGQDQRGKLELLARAAGLAGGPALCSIYDGDTPERERARIKRSFPRVVISNPDMLHLGILSSWYVWEPFLCQLRWVVLDELHTYRGIFGSHFHHVLQRLMRLCRVLGADPTVIASSATAANAGGFAETLLGQPFEWIAESGAPRAGRRFLLFQPAASPYTLTLELFAELLRRGLKTIVFTKARRITELLISWFRQQEPELARKVAGYRSGFLSSERRKIESDLFEGRLNGVISTSALEMGVDVGGLDACILVGFPGSVMATWQRSGRVGRGDRESITALVGLPDALDQYFLSHPSALIERPCEQLIVDPANEPVSRGHLLCAAAEKPLSRDLDRRYLQPLTPLVDELINEGLLHESADGRELSPELERPHRDVSLRGTGETTTILDAKNGRVVGTVDGVRVLHECHPGAIYLHQGRQYLVRELDLGARRVIGEPVAIDYYTSPLTEKETSIIEVLHERADGALAACLGRLKVTERVVGYERRRVRGQELLGQHDLDLPPVSYETVGLWWIAPAALEERLRSDGFHFMGALHASEHATISMLPLFALCDRGDIGGISIPMHPQLGCGAVFVYDGHPGGVGIAARAFHELPELLGRVESLIDSCECEGGCPSCIQSPKCGNGNRPLDKGGAHRFLNQLLADGSAGVGSADVGISARPILAASDLGAEEIEADEGSVESGRDTPADAGTVLPVGPGLPDDSDPGKSAEPQVVPMPGVSHRTMLLKISTQRSLADVGGEANAHKMRLAWGAVCHLEVGRIELFEEGEAIEMVTLLETADLIVGYDLLRQVYPVLAGYTGVDYALQWPTLDLGADLEQAHGGDFALDDLLRGTLEGSSVPSSEPEEEVRDARWCRQQLERIRDLYLAGRRLGHVSIDDGSSGRRELPVNW
jgi:DEAD/DEAH box helicase domain-containing protein